jgi:hypothetical protein
LTGILWCPGIHTKVIFFNSFGFSSTCMHYKTKNNSVEVFTSAARALFVGPAMKVPI